MGFHFDYTVHKCNCWLKTVNNWDKLDNSVLFAEKNIESRLNLLLMETEAATHVHAKFLRRGGEGRGGGGAGRIPFPSCFILHHRYHETPQAITLKLSDLKDTS